MTQSHLIVVQSPLPRTQKALQDFKAALELLKELGGVNKGFAPGSLEGFVFEMPRKLSWDEIDAFDGLGVIRLD